MAHDNYKADLLDWARFNRGTLAEHELFATSATGALIDSEPGLPVTRFMSARSEATNRSAPRLWKGDCIVFFWDPLEPHPHDVDVKALLRIAARGAHSGWCPTSSV